jgi:DNA-binding response OmpR family regulator
MTTKIRALYLRTFWSMPTWKREPFRTQRRRSLEKEQRSLYIIDGQLPGVSGMGLCEQIRRFDQQTPIIIFSGHGSARDLEAGMAAGANVYIVKPDTREIVPTVRRLLAQA